MSTVKAVPAGTLITADGRTVRMQDGPCLWCGEYVTSDRDAAGATNPLDACWQVDGDFGCDKSPESSDEGTGGHARPWDLAVLLLAAQREGRQ